MSGDAMALARSQPPPAYDESKPPIPRREPPSIASSRKRIRQMNQPTNRSDCRTDDSLIRRTGPAQNYGRVAAVLAAFGLAMSLVGVPACGGGPRASETPGAGASSGPGPSTPATPPRADAADAGAPATDAGAPATADLCPGIVRDALEDLTWFVNDFGVIGYVDIVRAPAVLEAHCKTLSIESQRCIAEPSPVWKDKTDCVDAEGIRRMQAALRPLLDPPASERVPPPKTGHCEYGALVERLQACTAVPERMRRKLRQQWQRSPGPPRNVCFDAERLLSQRLKEAGCP